MPFEYSHNIVAVEIEELVPRFWSKSKSLYQELWRYKERPYGIKRIENAFLNGIPLINF